MKHTKLYYSRRQGKIDKSPEMSLSLLKRLYLVIYNQMNKDGYFQKHFGYYCIDQNDVPGLLGFDVPSAIFISLRKDNLWPIYTKIEHYSEDDLFDIIEYLHDHCSKPTDGNYHRFNDCGMHYHTFHDLEGQAEYRDKVNTLLADYSEGFELSSKGEILSLPNSNLASLFTAEIPSTDEENITSKINEAVINFRRHRSTLDDRRNALRELADVLEYLRPNIKATLMSNDEKDIFNLANNFGVRHHNTNQKTKYDKAIWYSWMFYYYLATIHASLRLIDKQHESIEPTKN